MEFMRKILRVFPGMVPRAWMVEFCLKFLCKKHFSKPSRGKSRGNSTVSCIQILSQELLYTPESFKQSTKNYQVHGAMDI